MADELAPEIQTGGGDAHYGGVVRGRRGRRRRTGGMPTKSRPGVGPPKIFDPSAEPSAEGLRRAANPNVIASEAAKAEVKAAAKGEYLGILAPLMSVTADQAKIFKLPEGAYTTKTFKDKRKEWTKQFTYMFKTFVAAKGKDLDIERWEKYRDAQDRFINAIADIATFQNNKLTSKCGDLKVSRLKVLDEYFDIVIEELFGHNVEPSEDPSVGEDMAGGGESDSDDQTGGQPAPGGRGGLGPRIIALDDPVSNGLGGAVAAAQADDAAAAAAAPAESGAGGLAPSAKRRRGSVSGILQRVAGLFSDTSESLADAGGAALASVEDRIDAVRSRIRADPDATAATVGGAVGGAVGVGLLSSGAAAAAVSTGVGVLGYFGALYTPWAVIGGAVSTAVAAAPAAPIIGGIALSAALTHMTLRATGAGARMSAMCAVRAVPAAVGAADAVTDAAFEAAAAGFNKVIEDSDKKLGEAVGNVARVGFKGAAAVSKAAYRAGAKLRGKAIAGGRGRAAIEAAADPDVAAAIDDAVRSTDEAAASAAGGGGSAAVSAEVSQQYRSSLQAGAAASAADGIAGRKRRRDEVEPLDEEGSGSGVLAAALGAVPPGEGSDSKEEAPPPTGGHRCPTCGSSRKKRKSKSKKSRKHKKRHASYRRRNRNQSKSRSPSEAIYASPPAPVTTTLPHMESSGPPVRS